MKKYILIISIFSLFFLAPAASAQSSPEFLISWKAENYVPGWYGGKKIPIAGTPINVSFSLIDSGKPVNLSQNSVRWHVNGNLVKNEEDGLGINKIIFSSARNSKEALVRISVIDYAPDLLSASIAIPIANPETIIDSPYFNNEIAGGLSVFRAYPFFFNANNINELNAAWKVNNENSSGGSDPWVLNLNIGTNSLSGSETVISSVIKKISDIFETSEQKIYLSIK